MLKKSLWLLALAGPLYFTQACELLSNEAVRGALEGAGQSMNDPSGGGGSPGEYGGGGSPGEYGGGGSPGEYGGGGSPGEYGTSDAGVRPKPLLPDGGPRDCKPIPKEAIAKCERYRIEDRDQDGCPDFILCEDGLDDSGMDPKDKDPSMCKDLPVTLGFACKAPRGEDSDGDGCLDHFVCLDGFGDDEAEPLPKQ